MMTKGWVNPREVSTSVNCFKLTPYTNQHAQSQAATGKIDIGYGWLCINWNGLLLVRGAGHDGEHRIQTLENDRVDQHLAKPGLDREVKKVVAQFGHVLPGIQGFDGFQDLERTDCKEFCSLLFFYFFIIMQ